MEKKENNPWFYSRSQTEQKTETLVIHCSDYRFQKVFDQFLFEGLRLVSFDRLAFPGGPQFFSTPLHLPKFEWAGKKWMQFLKEKHGLKEIICIAHEDCGWYKEVVVGGFKFDILKIRQKDDLCRAEEVLQKMFPGIKVRLFFAHLKQEGNNVEFEEVT